MKKGTITVISTIAGILGGVLGHKYLIGNKRNSVSEAEKFKLYYHMLNQWLYLKENGKTLKSYFIENAYKSIAIYGMGEIGTHLYKELKGTGIEIKYVVDKTAVPENPEINIINTLENLEDADVIVVTPIFAFDEIEKELRQKVTLPIIYLEEINYEIYVQDIN